MKKAAFILMMTLSAGLFAGCGGTAPSGQTTQEAADQTAAAQVDLSSLKTLGDAFALEGKDEDAEQRSFYEDKYIYAFSVGGVFYRVIADLPADISEKLFALEYDDDHDKNEMALVSDLAIKKAENLTDQILTQEELDAFVGKTGKEMFDAGWRSGGFYNTETLEVWLEYGAFTYDIHFDGKLTEEEAENFEPEEHLADKKVLDIKYEGIGDASYVDEEADETSETTGEANETSETAEAAETK